MDDFNYKATLLFLFCSFSITLHANGLTALNQQRINAILSSLANHPSSDSNQAVESIINQLVNAPYIFSKGMGKPIYRFDGFDCQTLVQTVLALLHSNSSTDFDKNYIKVAYGATDKHHRPLFFNRNHFVETDLNPINRKNGWLRDVTSFHPHAETISAIIDRQKWFAKQGFHFEYKKQITTLSYLSKKELIINKNGHYYANNSLLAGIPTPAVVEIINDPQKWIYHGKPIKQAIGSELIVSHMGLLYRKTFNRSEVIYHRISCGLNWWHKKKCEVIPIRCQTSQCTELMLAHATNEYPSRFYWYKGSQTNEYICDAKKPPKGQHYGKCNRVEQVPLFSYLTNFHYGHYWNMENPALLGIHIEKITPPEN